MIQILTSTPNFREIGIETRYLKKILKEMAFVYARLLNQNKFKYHIIFSVSFYKIIEEDQRRDEIEFSINLNNNHNLTESDSDNIDVNSQLEHPLQIQETKESGWIFDRINSMKIKFDKTGELNGSKIFK